MKTEHKNGETHHLIDGAFPDGKQLAISISPLNIHVSIWDTSKASGRCVGYVWVSEGDWTAMFHEWASTNGYQLLAEVQTTPESKG